MSHSSLGPQSKRARYLCLEATQEGQPSHAHVNEIVDGLRRDGWDVRLFAPSYGCVEDPGAVRRLVEFVRVQARLMALRGDRPGVLYVRSHFAALPASLWARFRGIALVHEVNGPYEDLFIAWPAACLAAPLFRWLSRVQLRLADAVVVVTKGLDRWVREETGAEVVAVIPNAANVDRFRPGAPTSISLPERFVVFFGSLVAWQGIDTLLAAAEHPTWHAGVKLVVVGDGPERWRVEEAVARNPGIHYVGRVPQGELPGIIGRSIAGLVPKNDRGGRSATGLSPLKLYEILACGVPAIVTGFPGQAELIRDHDCGLVIPHDDPAALAAAVGSLATQIERRAAMGRRGRDLIVTGHSWEQRARATGELLMQVVRG